MKFLSLCIGYGLVLILCPRSMLLTNYSNLQLQKSSSVCCCLAAQSFHCRVWCTSSFLPAECLQITKVSILTSANLLLGMCLKSVNLPWLLGFANNFLKEEQFLRNVDLSVSLCPGSHTNTPTVNQLLHRMTFLWVNVLTVCMCIPWEEASLGMQLLKQPHCG